MKYSVSTWIYGPEPLDKIMARLAKFGYDTIEIKGEPKEFDVMEIRKLLRKYNLKASSIAGIYPWPSNRDLTHPETEMREKAIQYVKESLDFAKDVEAPLLIVVPSPVAKTKPLSPISEEWERCVDSVKKCAKFAEEAGVMIALEPINRYEAYLANRGEQAIKMAEEVDSPNVKIMLDCFHMNIEEKDPAAAIRAAKDWLIHLHVTDSNRQSVGRGHTNFASIMHALKEINFQGALTMEPLPPLHDPYIALTEGIPEEISDLYAEECITMLKFLEKVT